MSEVLRTPEQIVDDALRAELHMLLNQCTEKQQAFFHHLFPGGIDKQTTQRLKTAIGLCQRSIRKNESGRGHE
jgi:hypothetical protein